MKRAFVTALFLSILPLTAQATGLRLSEHREVMSATSALLAGKIDLHQDGTVRAIHQIGRFKTHIELKGLAVHEILRQPLTEEDAAKGITRRYHAKLKCEAHRIWDGPMTKWSEWRESGYGFFPTTVVVEEVRGILQASAMRITDFSSGSDGARTASAK